MTNKTLFLIGGTGGLGYEVAKGLVTAKGYDARKALVVAFQDYSDASALEEVLKGAHTIVSTLGGMDMNTLEKAIVDAAKANGTSLFVPSQFGVDYRRWGTEFPFLGGKKTVLDYAQEQGVKTLSVFTGLFSDWIFDFFTTPAENKATLIGDGSGKMSFTRRSDIGFVLAKALSDPSTLGDTLSMQGSTMSLQEALDLLADILGKPWDLETLPADEAKKQELELLGKGDIPSFFGSFRLHLLGEPQRGSTGCDTTAESNTYGHEMESLETTLKELYGSK